ncbi:MAG: phosphoribosylformylglycinamidine synthase subunit PurS [Bacteroidia bacterium]|nr:phosphoribosylformylglycinamidine synthase subunit PurS [Bacteroidia bacterium]
MQFKAVVHIMPRPEILDPQGKATLNGLKNLGFQNVESVRVGRRVELAIEADSKEEAEAKVQEASRKLLANSVTEVFRFEVLS